MAQDDSNNHFWQFEYYSVADPNVECIRITYKNQPFHLITIDDISYVLVEDISRCLQLTDSEGVYMLDRIPETEKTTRRMCRSNGDEYELALLTEVGLCKLISLVNTPEAYDFLKDIQDLLQQQEKPSTDVYARIAERFAVAKRKRIEANPNKLQSMDKSASQVLSSPSLCRGVLSRKPVKPASVFTIAASGTLTIYEDEQGNYWLDSRSVLKAIGHSAIADPATVFGDVPPCWLNDLIIADNEGEDYLIPCILLQGLLFYLAESDNLYSVYLMYYIALKLALRNGSDPSHAVDRLPLQSVFLQGNAEQAPAYSVRYLMDRQGNVWYIASDIIKEVMGVHTEGIESEVKLQKVPEQFKGVMFVRSGDKDEDVLCISEQGVWFFLSEYAEDLQAKKFIEWLIQAQPVHEDRLSLYRRLSGWRWPYINGTQEAPSYDSQLKGLEVVLNAYNTKNLTEWGFWGLNAVAEMTTGISPLTVIQRWERNKEKDAGIEPVE